MEFRDKPMENLIRLQEKDICKNARALLLDGESIVGGYKTCLLYTSCCRTLQPAPGWTAAVCWVLRVRCQCCWAIISAPPSRQCWHP